MFKFNIDNPLHKLHKIQAKVSEINTDGGGTDGGDEIKKLIQQLKHLLELYN